MKRKKPSDRSVKELAKKETRKEQRAINTQKFLLFLTLLSTCTLLIMVTAHYISTGYAVYLESQAGTITELIVYKEFPTFQWAGIYGLALRVDGFTELLDGDFSSGQITRQDVFFDCMDTSDPNGNEVYASISDNVDFNTLSPANPADLDAFMGCSSKPYCASNTFTDTMWIMVGGTNISNIPSTHTYKFNGDPTVFDIGILEDGNGNIVYVTKVEGVQTGYSEGVTVNYQMMTPMPENTTLTYYFYTDPNDFCPAGGGLGNTVDTTVHGFIKDELGNPVENATVILVGHTRTTNADGFYNFSQLELIEGNFTLLAQKTGYDDNHTVVPVTFTNYTWQKNITLKPETPGSGTVEITNIDGYVFDTDGNPIYEASVLIAGTTDKTDLFGYYSVSPTVTEGNQSIIAIKEGYNNNVTILNFSTIPQYKNVNFTLEDASAAVGEFETGPYTQQRISNIREQIVKSGEDYWVSTKEINKQIRQNTFLEETIGIFNFAGTMNLNIELDPQLEGIVSLDQTSMTIDANTFGELGITFYGLEDIGVYEGNISITGGLNQEIPVTVEIVERNLPIETMLVNVDLFDDSVRRGTELKYKLSLQNLLSDQGYLVYINSKVRGINNSIVYAEKNTQEEIQSSLTLLESIQLPEETPVGEYVLEIQAKYLNLISRTSTSFDVVQPIYLYAFLGIPLWIYMAIISFLGFVSLNVFAYKRHLDKKKRYSVKVDYGSLAQPGERTIRLGHIAETKKNAYLELEKLKVHTIVAGATGMGKSISAQVIIEEALLNDVCVIVFDPTAQWSGMLRKCEDKKMLSFYPKFGMKPSEARGFPGNIRAVKDARQKIDINKYFEPGHIQIFTLNKLQPKDMDIFVAGVIRQIFKSDPKESQELKILLVFDEVHRLLPKFGGSGEGFLQIERGCREFRKWGIGQILISQVMSDFVGEIKANINTEVQTRTVEEGDLERIKSKFGESYLTSLVKSEVGVAMFQNAEYNKGLPYFINFRPILHNTRRLSDEELEKYNKYNDQIEDLEYQIEQLEELKLDVFDLKMEIKLVKDKIMTGNFSVVDIYLEGLVPRVAKQWEKIGKKPKKKQVELIDIEEIKKSVEEAKKGHEKAASESKAEESQSTEKEKDPLKELEQKQVSSLTFDNGAMVSSLGELKDMLPTLDDDIFKIHVNAQKNDIATWAKEVSPTLSAKLAQAKDKATMIKILKEFDGKEGAPPAPAAKPSTQPQTKPAPPKK